MNEAALPLMLLGYPVVAEEKPLLDQIIEDTQRVQDQKREIGKVAYTVMGKLREGAKPTTGTDWEVITGFGAMERRMYDAVALPKSHLPPTLSQVPEKVRVIILHVNKQAGISVGECLERYHRRVCPVCGHPSCPFDWDGYE